MGEVAIKQKVILIVEDDNLLSNLYYRKFEAEGFAPMIAHDGQEGLKLAETKVPDFILLDNMLPKLNGLEVLAQIKKNPLLKDTPVVILSNLAFAEERDRALELGAKEYLAKAGQTPEAVVEKVKSYLK